MRIMVHLTCDCCLFPRGTKIVGAGFRCSGACCFSAVVRGGSARLVDTMSVFE